MVMAIGRVDIAGLPLFTLPPVAYNRRVIEVRRTDVFTRWFNSLRDQRARERINTRIIRLAEGNPGDVRPVGKGVAELRIDYGPGYRVYYTQRGKR